MKTLYLLRHAKSAWDEPGLADFDRPLASRGQGAAPRMGAFMREHQLVPELVLCSSARRAVETWDRLVPSLEADIAVDHDEALYMAAPAALLDRVRQAPDRVSRLLVLGHNPGLQRFAVALCGSGKREALTQMRGKFPTAALAVIEFEIDRWQNVANGLGRLARFVRPKALS